MCRQERQVGALHHIQKQDELSFVEKVRPVFMIKRIAEDKRIMSSLKAVDATTFPKSLLHNANKRQKYRSNEQADSL